MKRSTRTQRSKHAQAQRNACAGRLLASSGPTTLSFVLSVTFKERVQGIGVAIGGVNAQLCLLPHGVVSLPASCKIYSPLPELGLFFDHFFLLLA
jgi:hypothetical protein